MKIIIHKRTQNIIYYCVKTVERIGLKLYRIINKGIKIDFIWFLLKSKKSSQTPFIASPSTKNLQLRYSI